MPEIGLFGPPKGAKNALFGHFFVVFGAQNVTF